MRITAIEEIEARKAFLHRNYCPRCGSTYYHIHHQISPTDKWWISCYKCHYESEECSTRNIAFASWRHSYVKEEKPLPPVND